MSIEYCSVSEDENIKEEWGRWANLTAAWVEARSLEELIVIYGLPGSSDEIWELPEGLFEEEMSTHSAESDTLSIGCVEFGYIHCAGSRRYPAVVQCNASPIGIYVNSRHIEEIQKYWIREF